MLHSMPYTTLMSMNKTLPSDNSVQWHLIGMQTVFQGGNRCVRETKQMYCDRS